MTTITANFSNATIYNLVMANAQKIGNKTFAFVPVQLLAFDPAYQRHEDVSVRKIKNLEKNWNDNLCDALQVSPHPEEGKFYVFNGYHRFTVATEAFGRDNMVCEIMTELSDLSPEDRRREEAKLFSKQSDAVDRLSAVQRHNANVIIGNPADVLVEALCKKYGVKVKPDDSRGLSKKANTLTGIVTALRIAKNPQNYLDNIFNVICSAGWNKGTTGFTSDVIDGINLIFTNHPDKRDEISNELIKWFRTLEPTTVQAMGEANYPMRHKRMQMALEIEDYLHKTINLPYTYTEKTTSKRSKKKTA